MYTGAKTNSSMDVGQSKENLGFDSNLLKSKSNILAAEEIQATPENPEAFEKKKWSFLTKILSKT